MNHQDTTRPEATPRHTIAVVSRRTGISQLLLRAWERRYGAVAPGRTDSGRRLYSDEDVRKLLLLNSLTDHGHRIGDIAGLTARELETLAGEAAALPSSPAVPLPDDAAIDALLGQALQAVADMDAPALESLLGGAAASLSRASLRRDLLAPLMNEVGERWHDGELGIAHEHLATAIVRAVLANLILGAAEAGAPALIVTTPTGQRHELGALMAAHQAVEAGFRIVYLGPDLPAEEIAAAVDGCGARAVLLSLVYPAAHPATIDQLLLLRRRVGDDLPIIVGGAATPSYAASLDRIGAHVITHSEALDRALGVIRSAV